MVDFVVAMSGGIDSSFVVANLLNQGHNVIGVTLDMTGNMDIIKQAKKVANQFNIPHEVIECRKQFHDIVISNFVNTYFDGKTPLPCAVCNRFIKLDLIMQFANSKSIDNIATGHYVRKIQNGSKFELHKGIDPVKDQSYFLFMITQEQLKRFSFPLGNMTKKETKLQAAKLGLNVSDFHESNDICFVKQGYVETIKEYSSNKSTPGKILHIDGYELGDHKGIIHYTVGQRRGLGISSEDPLYVVKIDADKNIVFVGHKKDLFVKEFIFKKENLLCNNIYSQDVQVKIRSTIKAKYARLSQIDSKLIKVEFITPQESIAPGQACVVYKGSMMCGGGWIL